MRKILVLCLLAFTLVGCGGNKKNAIPERPMHECKRAMYHWKNTFSFDDDELEFLKKHNIERLYIRFFDVTLEDLIDGQAPQAVPSATVCFKDTWRWCYDTEEIPEIIPTIFITPEAILSIDNKEQTNAIAKKMLERIDNMCSYYQIPKEKVKEIQLDCDWTMWSEQPFFRFCRAVRKAMPKFRLLSSTIRLHQLGMQEPPVDYGVLMLYNTNNLRNPEIENSILSANDVKPYLKNVKYKLPLDLAYPTFAWDLWFQNGKFRGIIRSESKADSLRQAGEMIRHEEVNFEEIMKVKKLVEAHLPKPKHERSTILYHLDKNNLKKYTSNEIENIFGR